MLCERQTRLQLYNKGKKKEREQEEDLQCIAIITRARICRADRPEDIDPFPGPELPEQM